MNDNRFLPKLANWDPFASLRAAADLSGRMLRTAKAEGARLDDEQAAADRRAESLLTLDRERRLRSAQLCVRCPNDHVLVEVHDGHDGLIVLLPYTVKQNFEMETQARARTVARRRSSGQVFWLAHAGREIATECERRCTRRLLSTAEVHEWLAAGDRTVKVA